MAEPGLGRIADFSPCSILSTYLTRLCNKNSANLLVHVIFRKRRPFPAAVFRLVHTASVVSKIAFPTVRNSVTGRAASRRRCSKAIASLPASTGDQTPRVETRVHLKMTAIRLRSGPARRSHAPQPKRPHTPPTSTMRLTARRRPDGSDDAYGHKDGHDADGHAPKLLPNKSYSIAS